jgi:transcriptional regulator with XRE-family HTH domain
MPEVTKRKKPRRSPRSNGKRATPGDKVLGQRLRARRLELRISQAELGKTLGVSFQQIQKYEKGINRIGAARLTEVAAALDTNIDYFLGDLGKNETAQKSEIAEFMSTKDGVDMAKAMISMPFAKVRRHIITLCRTIGSVYSEK